jgi:hypothetical protein
MEVAASGFAHPAAADRAGEPVLDEILRVHAAIARQGVRDGRALQPTLLAAVGSSQAFGRPADAATVAVALALALDEHPALLGGAFNLAPGAQPFCFSSASVALWRAQGRDPGAALRDATAAQLFPLLARAPGAAPKHVPGSAPVAAQEPAPAPDSTPGAVLHFVLMT